MSQARYGIRKGLIVMKMMAAALRVSVGWTWWSDH
jgi:hypothetical protein